MTYLDFLTQMAILEKCGNFLTLVDFEVMLREKNYSQSI